MTNHLYYGDNLNVLRDSIASTRYNVLFKAPQKSRDR